MADDQLRETVSRMIAAGESEANIALVIQRLSHDAAPAEPATYKTRFRDDLVKMGMPANRARALTDMELGGVGSGPLEVVGKPAVGLGMKLARRIYGGLLKPKQGVKDSFGEGVDIAAHALEERIPITRGGLTKATTKLGASRSAALKTVADADAAGARGVRPGEIVSEFGDTIKELRNRVDIGQPNQLAQVGQRGRAIVRTANRGANPGDVSLTRAQQLKETAQDAASGAYRAVERGTQKQLSADDLLDADVARGFRKGIEARVPDVAQHNQRTQKLLGVTRSLEDAIDRDANALGVGGAKDMLALATGGGAFAAGAGPLAIPIAMGTRALTTPSTGSAIAIGLNELSKKGVLDASTRAAILMSLKQRSGEP
jgi:hypothetical protein